MAAYRPTQIRKPSDETDFEKNCVVLFKEVLADPNVKRLGTRGQKQKGIDLIGKRDQNSKKPVGVQCKLKSGNRKLTAREVRDEFADALTFRPQLTEYFIVTTSKDDAALDELAKQLSQEQESEGRKIHIEVWGWDTLSEKINQSEAAKDAFDPGFSPSMAAQNQKLDIVIEGQAATNEQVAALTAAVQRAPPDVVLRFPPQLADRELNDGFSRALRRRGFVGTDIGAELAALAERAIDGELSLGSAILRAEICDRAARSNIAVRAGELSRRFRDCAHAFDPIRDLRIADAVLKEAAGDPDGALRDLRSQNRPDGEMRAAIFTTFVRRQESDAALKWVESEGLSAADFSAPGAMNLVLTEIGSGEFDTAVQKMREVPDDYFAQCPALYLIRAQLRVASILPVDQKAGLFQGLPTNPSVLQPDVTSGAEEGIVGALADLQHLLRVLGELNLGHLERFLSEFDLWLRLQNPGTKEAARAQLAAEIADPEKTLHRVRLALAYDVPFNREALERHLVVQKQFGGWTADERHAAFLLIYHSANPERIAAFFDTYHDDLFNQTELAYAALASIEIEIFARTGRFDDARRHISQHQQSGHLTDDQAQQLEEIVGHIEKGDEVESFRQRYVETQNLTDLRVLIAALRNRRDLKQLADYAPRLARATKAREDFDLAIRCLFDSKDYHELIGLTEELPQLQQLDDDYAAARGWALAEVGRLIEARDIARQLLTRRNVPRDRELAVLTAIETGDWGNLQAILAREAARADALLPGDLMRLARLALEAGSPYVDQFRDAALRKSPDDPEINLAAYALATERGAEYQGTQAHAWFQKAIAQSGSDGPVRSVSMREIIDQAPSWNQHRENVDQMLRRGDVPVFIAAKAVRRQVLDLTLGQALRNSDPSDKRVRYPVFAFSGAQPDHDIAAATCVALDITAIITLDFLGLLEAALARFDQVVIAPKTLSMPFLERQFLRFHQPSEIAKAQRLQALIGAGGLKLVSPEASQTSALAKEIGAELATLLTTAQREGGVLVRSAPVFKLGSFLEEHVDMSSHAPVLADTLAVVSYLLTAGKLDSETKERAETYLKQVDQGWDTEKTISSDSKLYLDDLTVNYLDHVGLLEILTNSVSAVFVYRDLDNNTRNLLHYGKHTEDLISAIERIRSTIAQHVESGRIRFSERHARDSSAGEEREEILESAPTLDLMSDLSGIPVVIADDRCLNKLPTWTDGAGRSANATSSLSILAALKTGGQLDDKAYWRARHRLRAAAFYAVPIEVAELMNHLASATTVNGALRETPELRAIRQSISLPRINDAFVAPEELWLNRIRYTVYKAMRETWLHSTNLDRARAEADWLWSILPNPLEWCLAPEVETVWAAARQQLAVQVGLMLAFIDASADRRNRYFGWLQDTVISPLEEGHPEIWTATLEFLKSYVVQLIDTRGGDADTSS